MTRTLIVGANQAGVQLACSLRELGDIGEITLLGAETHPPYQRPPLSKAFLSGTADADALAFRTPEFYTEHRIEVRTGRRVESLALDPGGPAGSGRALTRGGESLPFDRLALTTGARPRRLAVPGADLAGVGYLRDLDDALRLRGQLDAARRVVVVGGGYIGLEAAAVARSAGLEVTVVEAAQRLIQRSAPPVVSEFYRAAHERRGTEIRLGSGVEALIGDDQGRVRAVLLADGTEVPADLVLVGIGILPRTELAEGLGLHCAGGIVVDRHARTSEPAIVAAGDCAVAPDPLTGEGSIRLESVQNAVGQAKAAAASLLGREAPHTAVPWFWSDQYDLKLQIAGVSAGADQYVVRGDPAAERFSVLSYRAGRLLAVDAVNNAPDYLVVRKALGQGARIPADRAALDRPLKDLVVARDTVPS